MSDFAAAFLTVSLDGHERRLPALRVGKGAVHYPDLEFGDFVPYDEANRLWADRLGQVSRDPDLRPLIEGPVSFRLGRGPVIAIREPINLALDYQRSARGTKPAAYLWSNLHGVFAGDDGDGWRYREAAGVDVEFVAGQEALIAPALYFALEASAQTMVVPGRRARLSPLAVTPRG